MAHVPAVAPFPGFGGIEEDGPAFLGDDFVIDEESTDAILFEGITEDCSPSLGNDPHSDGAARDLGRAAAVESFFQDLEVSPSPGGGAVAMRRNSAN